MRLELKRNDTAKPVEVVLEDEDGIIGLLGATVRFHMVPAPESGLEEPVVDGLATIVDENAEEGDADFGKVRYFFDPEDTAVAGVFRAEFEVTFGNGTQESFPSDENIDVIIYPDLG